MIKLSPRVGNTSRNRNFRKSANLRLLTWTRIMLDRLVLTYMVSLVRKLEVLEVLHGLLDGGVQPPRGSLLELDVWLHEVLHDPGGFDMAQLILER